MIAEEIAEAYKIVYNQAITTRQPLEEIYSSHVKPIHKGGLKTKAANYRQVSMLSVSTKVYDKIIKKVVDEHLTKNNLKDNKNYGGKRKSNTLTCITDLLNFIVEQIENNPKDAVLFCTIDIKNF